MATIDLVHASMLGCKLNTGAERVALYVDPLNLHEQNYLPVMVPDGQAGYVEFLPLVRDEITRYFGADLGEAERLAREINDSHRISAREAVAIVGRSMELQAREQGR
jgi:hypothetical protein